MNDSWPAGPATLKYEKLCRPGHKRAPEAGPRGTPPDNIRLFHHRPDETLKPGTKIEAAFYKADHAIQNVLDLLAA
jgi:methylmalonyl-CoA mutase cobalamin-binding subunit